MESLVLDVPAMYADHHVLEVRRILLGTPGVEAVEASSAFRVVETRFDPERTSAGELRRLLDDAGYVGDLELPQETGAPAVDHDGTYFRHSTALEIAGAPVGFEQEIEPPSRPLWPCPGLPGAVRREPRGGQLTEV